MQFILNQKIEKKKIKKITMILLVNSLDNIVKFFMTANKIKFIKFNCAIVYSLG